MWGKHPHPLSPVVLIIPAAKIYKRGGPGVTSIRSIPTELCDYDPAVKGTWMGHFEFHISPFISF